jgi:hypothetical protein
MSLCGDCAYAATVRELGSVTERVLDFHEVQYSTSLQEVTQARVSWDLV